MHLDRTRKWYPGTRVQLRNSFHRIRLIRLVPGCGKSGWLSELNHSTRVVLVVFSLFPCCWCGARRWRCRHPGAE
eukprot:833734-Rhodomonas_salina.5